jgi:hypothetical protein
MRIFDSSQFDWSDVPLWRKALTSAPLTLTPQAALSRAREPRTFTIRNERRGEIAREVAIGCSHRCAVAIATIVAMIFTFKGKSQKLAAKN